MDALASAQAAVAATGGPQGVWANEFLHVALKTTFGPIVELVGDSLLTRGPQSLDELYRTTGLDVPTLKKALLTLVQQDVVQPAYEPVIQRQGAARKTRAPRVLYTIQVAHIRHRTRFAAYLLYIKQLYNADCEVILQTLVLHGKLSSKQIMDLTCANINEKNRLQAQEMHKQLQLASTAGAAKPASAYFPPPPIPADQRRSIQEIFRKLIAARYIVRATGLVMPTENDPDAPAAISGSGSTAINTDILATFLSNNAAVERKNAAATQEAAAQAAAPAAQAALKAATAAPSRKRKMIKEDDEEDEGKEKEAAAAEDAKPARKKKKTKKELEAEAAAAEKERRADAAEKARQKSEAEASRSLERALAAADDDDDEKMGADGEGGSVDHDDGNDVLWVVNHAEFLWEFRKKAIVEYVSGQVGPAAGFLIQQLLAQYPAEVCHPTSPDRPPVYDTDAIVRMCVQAGVQQNLPNPVPNADVAEDLIHQLLGDSTQFFERKSHPKGFLINFPQLFTELKLKHLQAHCRARFGSLAARIFRCLLIHKRLEETQVAEYATAPRKEVRRLLYLMHNAKLLSLQEVPRSSDRMPTKTFFLWGVDTRVANETYRESLYFAWTNLRVRLDQETDAAKPILDKIDTSKPITDQEKAQVEMWKKAADRLEGGINQLNNLIMLFQDF